MRVLLAGGAGFIGYHFTRRLLEQNHEVLTVDNFSSGRWSNVRGIRSDFPAGPFAVLRGDVCGLRLLDQRLDAVIHLASLASPPDYLRHPIETLEAGSVGTRSLLEIARRSR